MNKNWLRFSLPLLAGGTLLAVGGLSAMAGTGTGTGTGTSGYELYKSALKNNISAHSMTAHVTVTAMDNNEQIISAHANVKADKEQDIANAAISLDDGQQSRTLQVYRQEGKVILKHSAEDTYYTADKPAHHGPAFIYKNGGPRRALEHVFDVLIGHAKREVKQETLDNGQTQVTLHLSENQIHPLVHMIGAHAVTSASRPGEVEGRRKAQQLLFGGGFDPEFPELTADVKVESLDLTATITPDHHIAHEKIDIGLTGKDEHGETHSVKLHIETKFAGFNATAAEALDLTGKQLEEFALPPH